MPTEDILSKEQRNEIRQQPPTPLQWALIKALINGTKLKATDKSNFIIYEENKTLTHSAIQNRGLYALGNTFSGGGCGKVKNGWSENGKHYVIKIQKTALLKAYQLEPENEINILKDLGILVDEISRPSQQFNVNGEEKLYLVMEYLGPSLDFYLKDKHLTEAEQFTLAIELAEAVKNLHNGSSAESKTEYVHLDLKPQNFTILENEDNRVRIIDFGVSEKYSEFQVTNEKFVLGTQNYLPEEPGNQNTKALDIFALLRTLYIQRKFKQCNYGYPARERARDKDISMIFSDSTVEKNPILEKLLNTAEGKLSDLRAEEVANLLKLAKQLSEQNLSDEKINILKTSSTFYESLILLMRAGLVIEEKFFIFLLNHHKVYDIILNLHNANLLNEGFLKIIDKTDQEIDQISNRFEQLRPKSTTDIPILDTIYLIDNLKSYKNNLSESHKKQIDAINGFVEDVQNKITDYVLIGEAQFESLKEDHKERIDILKGRVYKIISEIIQKLKALNPVSCISLRPTQSQTKMHRPSLFQNPAVALAKNIIITVNNVPKMQIGNS